MTAVNLKDARRRLGSLVDAAERGHATVITRRGREVARLVPADSGPRRGLPDLTGFRASIDVKGGGLTETLIAARMEERQ